MPEAAKKITSGAVVGKAAPDFSMTNEQGEIISLASFAGKNLVLYFYPKDDTPGCTLEAQDFRGSIGDFTAANTVILGVSKDDAASHQKFIAKHCLPFSLGVDTHGNTCEAYGVWVEKNMYGKKYMGIQRATFLIDTHGIVAASWPKVKVEGHALEVLAAAKKLSA
jgi:thioredoxin-dependent peroxiredoxin